MEHYRSVIRSGQSEGTEVEVYALKRDMKSVRIVNNEIVEAQNVVESGAGIRAVKDGSIGFSATNRLDRDSLHRAFSLALKMARLSVKLPNWRGLPANVGRSARPSTIHSEPDPLSNLPGDLAEVALEILGKTKRSDLTVRNLTAVLMAVSEEFSVFNSNGIEQVAEPNFILYSRMMVEVKKDDVYSTATRQFCYRMLSEFDPCRDVTEVLDAATRLALLPRKRITGTTKDVILSPTSVGALMSYLLVPMITGYAAENGISCFSGRIGSTVAAKSFSLSDDGRIEGGAGSARVDDEGTPTQLTRIIENGVFRGFLFDTLTACLSNTHSTGNARRTSDMIGRTYLKPPEPLPNNLIISSGDYGFGELVADTNDGLILESIGYSFHLVPELGYFKIASSLPVLVIKDGEVVSCTQGLTFSGDLINTLSKIDGIEKPAQQSINMGSIVTFSPHLRIKDMTVTYDS